MQLGKASNREMGICGISKPRYLACSASRKYAVVQGEVHSSYGLRQKGRDMQMGTEIGLSNCCLRI